jgi:spermidine/putrescine transport system permease protein
MSPGPGLFKSSLLFFKIKEGNRKAMQNKQSKYWLLTPSYGWLSLAVFGPLLIMFVFSFMSDVPMGARAKDVHFTLEHYLEYFSQDFYWILTKKSMLTAFYTTFICLLIAYPMAYFCAKTTSGKWKTAIFMLVIIPLWSNTLVRVYSWSILLRDGGVIELFLETFGLSGAFGSMLYTYPAIIIGLVHGYLPFMTLSIYVSLDRLDNSLLEASASLGANKLQTFFRVVLPLSLPGVVAGSIMTFIPVLGCFVEPRILGGKRGSVIGTVIEDQFIQLFNWPFGAAVAFLMLLMVLSIMVLAVFISKRLNRMSLDGGK